MRQQACRLIVIVLSCLLAEVGLHADEQYPLRRLEVEDGLSQNMVYCIRQDSQGFMWFGTQDGLNRYDGNTFKVFRNGGKECLGNDGILCLEENSAGQIYVGTLQGLYIYEPMSEDFTKVALGGKVRDIQILGLHEAYVIVDDRSIVKVVDDVSVLPVYSISSENESLRSICADDEGNLWVAGYSVGLARIGSDGLATTYRYSDGEENMFTKVLRKDAENLLVGTIDQGVLNFNLRTHTFSSVVGLDGSDVYFVHDLLFDSKGRIWAGAENGLFILGSSKTKHLIHIPNNPYSLSDNAVFSISEDNEGGIWIGTYFGGVNYYSEFLSQFRKYFPIPGYNELMGKNMSEFLEAEDGTIWIGTEDAGLYMMDPVTGEFQTGFVPATNVHALAELDGSLWVGTYGDGLFIVNRKTGAKKNVLFSKLGYSQMDDNVYAIYRDVAGVTFIGTDAGLYEYQIPSGRLVRLAPELIFGGVNDICQDFYGNIWVSTAGSGLFLKDASTGQWKKVETSSNYLSCILEDSRHDMWFGTEDSGLLHFVHATGRFDLPYTIEDGLPDEMVYMILEDGSGNIWGSTNHGIFRVVPRDRRVVVFDHNSGLACDQYNYRSGVKTKDGGFYFGGVKGFVGFYPDEINWPEVNSRIVFNRFLLRGKQLDLKSKDSPLTESITFTDNITLKQKDAVFSIGFADLSYALSGVRNYQYRLTGLDDIWYESGKSHLLSFSDLHPGHYVLEVRASSYADGFKSKPASIAIHVLPPWYQTWWAIVLYSVIALVLVFVSISLFITSSRKKNKEMLETLEREKEKELYDAKIRFFTNITHEIRTPLTLITAPMDEIMERTGKDNSNFADLSIVQKNSKRLLSLVNELLDFRKVEAGHLLPNFVKTNIVALVEETAARFMPRIATEKLTLSCDLPERLDADVDGEIVTKIISNILSNACKHASTRIVIKLEAAGNVLRLSITNDGAKIPESKVDSIFAPFVKLDENVPGSGLGLAFARTLATTHDGDIYLDTSSEETCFVVELPLVQKNVVISENVDEAPEEESNIQESDDSRAKILVVDDNEDFRSFLSRKIGEQYEVLTADNGNSALAVLAKEYVDLIVTDLMMPGMDGASFCATLKDDIRTSHIPVILVTAKSDMNTRMDCIKQGADDFIPKPFQTSYLMVRIENMLKSRDTLLKAFRSTPEFSVESIATSKKDEEFILRLNHIIEEKLDAPELDVDYLADAMNMSRATFYRKMKGFTEESPNDFIRLYRLRRAAEMLADGSRTINEVSIAVGFSSSSYFSRCFSKQFGVSPKDYASR